jgi:hypothetical protein
MNNQILEYANKYFTQNWVKNLMKICLIIITKNLKITIFIFIKFN